MVMCCHGEIPAVVETESPQLVSSSLHLLKTFQYFVNVFRMIYLHVLRESVYV